MLKNYFKLILDPKTNIMFSLIENHFAKHHFQFFYK
ncbi:hypothetical protein PRO82_000270 [Candidatus Protochlamydia amoebophila]|nr:hypothetical protein [Candidatus Protochlamydia amoebophila]